MLPSFADHTITVTEPGTKRDHGNDVDDWDNPQPQRTYEGCWAEPAKTTENNRRRQGVRAGYDVLLPPGSVVYPTSKVTLQNGLDYKVIGDPAEVPSASGELDCIALYVERWTG